MYITKKGSGQPNQQRQDRLNKSSNHINQNPNDKQSINSYNKNIQKDQDK